MSLFLKIALWAGSLLLRAALWAGSRLLKAAVAGVIYAAKSLPRAELAGVARAALAELAGKVEPLTTSKIVHEAEEVAFHELDALLAKIQGQ